MGFTHVVIDCPPDLAAEGYPPSVYWAKSADEAQALYDKIVKDNQRDEDSTEGIGVFIFKAGENK